MSNEQLDRLTRVIDELEARLARLERQAVAIRDDLALLRGSVQRATFAQAAPARAQPPLADAADGTTMPANTPETSARDATATATSAHDATANSAAADAWSTQTAAEVGVTTAGATSPRVTDAQPTNAAAEPARSCA